MHRYEPGAEGEGDSPAQAHLRGFLQENAANLQAIIRSYVAKMGLAVGGNIEAVAADIFQDSALEALAHAERLYPNMQTRAWFLGIAANILKRHRASSFKRSQHETLTSNLAQQTSQENEQDVLDQILGMRIGENGPEQAFVARESAHALLALVAPEDAQLLHMALVQGWDATSLSQMIGVTPVAARTRVHRALKRLRMAWQQSEQRKEHGGYHGKKTSR